MYLQSLQGHRQIWQFLPFSDGNGGPWCRRPYQDTSLPLLCRVHRLFQWRDWRGSDAISHGAPWTKQLPRESLEVSYLSFHKGRGRGSRAGWMTWFLLWNGWLNTSKRPFRKRKEPRFLCSNWFSPGPNGAFSSRGIIQAPKGNVIVCIPMREHPQSLKYTLIRACEICGGHLAIRTFTDVLNRKCLLGKF